MYKIKQTQVCTGRDKLPGVLNKFLFRSRLNLTFCPCLAHGKCNWKAAQLLFVIAVCQNLLKTWTMSISTRCSSVLHAAVALYCIKAIVLSDEFGFGIAIWLFVYLGLINSLRSMLFKLSWATFLYVYRFPILDKYDWFIYLGIAYWQ